MPEDDPFLTVAQIAAELDVTEVSVRQWIRDGRLKAIRAGRSYRVRRSALDEMTGQAAHTPRPTGPVSLESEPLLAQIVVPDDR
jgi:excisionase family DNA binding protein